MSHPAVCLLLSSWAKHKPQAKVIIE